MRSKITKTSLQVRLDYFQSWLDCYLAFVQLKFAFFKENAKIYLAKKITKKG